jgi:hypothetical protein
MLNDELKEGNFLVPRFHRVNTPRQHNAAGHDLLGVLHGTHLDLVAELIEAGKYFANSNHSIDCFRYDGKRYSGNASVEPVEEGLVTDACGTIVKTDKGYEFRPKVIAEKPFLQDLRSQEGFVQFARTLRLEAGGIAIEDGFLRLYGEHQLPPERKGRLQSTPLADIAKRLYEKAVEQPKSEQK